MVGLGDVVLKRSCGVLFARLCADAVAKHISPFMRAVSVAAALAAFAVGSMAGTFEINHGMFMRDGKPFRIMAGSIHYSRVHPTLWEDRLQRLRSMGLNSVEVRDVESPLARGVGGTAGLTFRASTTEIVATGHRQHV